MTLHSHADPSQTVENRRWARISTDPYADGSEGYAAVELPDGSFRRGWVVGSSYQPPPGGSVVVFEGWEVELGWFDAVGERRTDRQGRPLPSGVKTDGLTWHRPLDPERPDVLRVSYVHRLTPRVRRPL